MNPTFCLSELRLESYQLNVKSTTDIWQNREINDTLIKCFVNARTYASLRKILTTADTILVAPYVIGTSRLFRACSSHDWHLNINIWAATWQNQQSDCAPSEDSDQPWHPPSLIGVFAVRMKKAWVLSYPFSAQRRLWSDWADAQADLSLRCAHSHFVGFAMSQLILSHNDTD